MTKQQEEQGQSDLLKKWKHRTEFNTQSRVEEIEEKKIVRAKVPSEFQGHRIALDMFNASKERVYSGPFRIEYILCNEFIVYADSIPKTFLNLDLNHPCEGFSNLRVVDQIASRKMVLSYGLEDEQPNHKVEITTKVHDGILQGLIVTLPEQDLETAVSIADQFVAAILDYICFRKRIPLQIHHIDVYHAETGDLRCKYLTFPYMQTVDLEDEDMHAPLRIPNPLVPLLRLFREAMNSTSPPYRLLCLYRVKEGVEKIRRANNRKIRAKGHTILKRLQRLIPDTEMTQKFLPNYIGKPFDKFLDLVREMYRKNIAHLNFDEYARIFFDPSATKDQNQIDNVNAVLLTVMQVMIKDEWEFMVTHALV